MPLLTLMRVKASQRISALAGWSIFRTRAWTIFPPTVLCGRPTTSHSPVSSANRSPTWSCISKTVRVAGGAGSGFCSGRGLAIQTTPAQEKRISFAQPRGLTKGYFCPHLVHQTACSLSRLGLSRASRRFAPHRHAPTGVEHFWQNRTFVASKHLRCTNAPRTLIQKVGPEYIHHIPYLESRGPATSGASQAWPWPRELRACPRSR